MGIAADLIAADLIAADLIAADLAEMVAKTASARVAGKELEPPEEARAARVGTVPLTRSRRAPCAAGPMQTRRTWR